MVIECAEHAPAVGWQGAEVFVSDGDSAAGFLSKHLQYLTH